MPDVSLYSHHVQILTTVSAETAIRNEGNVVDSFTTNIPLCNGRRKSWGILKELFERMKTKKQYLRSRQSSISTSTRNTNVLISAYSQNLPSIPNSLSTENASNHTDVTPDDNKENDESNNVRLQREF
jgi:hypothetical protein